MKDIAADHTLCQENSPHFHGKGNGGPSPGEASLTELGSKFASQSLSAMSPLPGRPPCNRTIFRIPADEDQGQEFRIVLYVYGVFAIEHGLGSSAVGAVP
jgi:hypothetical protein